MKKCVSLVIIIMFCSNLICCSGYVYKNKQDLFLCASLDQMALHGYIIVNKRNIEKFNLLIDGPKVLRWVSKYGSVTFSSIGKEFPYGGMNEEGLTVAVMTTSQMKYPKHDARFEINESQWVQYILDNYSSIKEVIESDRQIRVNRFFDNWHYLLCDQEGNVAIIEFNNGKMTVYSGSKVKVPVLENTLYKKSLENYKNDIDRNRLTSRFSTLEYLLNRTDSSWTSSNPAAKLFSILDYVKQGITKYQIIYDIKNRKIEYRATTFKYLTDKNSTDYSQGISKGSLDFIDIDFSGTTLAAKLGIIGVSNEQFLPFNKVFDSDILKYNVEIIKSQGAKNITAEIVENYIQFAKRE